jgi:hypothetical protein
MAVNVGLRDDLSTQTNYRTLKANVSDLEFGNSWSDIRLLDKCHL